MTTYRVAALPTIYRGRQYRSRLEAKWAAFFDLLGWDHEYEPFDLGSWSPDFLLSSPTGSEFLVEVKPLTAFDGAVAEKVCRAVKARGLQDSLTGLLLLGLGPQRVPRGLRFGWLGSVCDDEGTAAEWAEPPLTWIADLDRPVMMPDFLSITTGQARGNGWHGFMTDACGPDGTWPTENYVDHTLGLWASACNAVQWKPKGGRA
jgi:hypothetical protein